MREALHVIDNEVVKLPHSTTSIEVSNLKKLADKDLFQCPYCSAKLRVKYGEERGLYFSHQHSEACSESKEVDKAEKRYGKQTERERKIHKVMIAIVHDELTTQAKNNPQIRVDYGFKAKSYLKEYPDIWVEIADKEFALSIVTDVKSTMDYKLANQISKRHQYFLEQGMEPIWFIEKKEQSIEKDKHSIILWDAELSISAKTKEDKKWDSMLADILKDKTFFRYYNYPVSMDNLVIDVRSMYYIYSNEDRIVVKVQRFLKDRAIKPYRAFLLNEGYEIPFADALVVKKEFLLSQPKIEEQYRNVFVKNFQQLQFQFQEQQRKQMEQRQLEEEQKKKIMQEMLKQQGRKQILLEEMLEQKQGTGNQTNIYLTYNDLKSFLRKRIHLTQKEQMELWTRFMPKIGLNNSVLVWKLVNENDCKSFNELRTILQNTLGNQYQS